MTRTALTFALVLVTAAPAFATEQLARSLGVIPGIASLGELALLKSTLESEDDNNNRDFRYRRDRLNARAMVEGFDLSPDHLRLAASLGVRAQDHSVADLLEMHADRKARREARRAFWRR